MLKIVISFVVFFTASAPAAFADFKLADGVYNTRFPGGCGNLAIKGGKYAYQYRVPCGGPVTYSAAGRWDGKVLRIGYATFKVTSATASNITGKWTLGSYTKIHTFRRK